MGKLPVSEAVCRLKRYFLFLALSREHTKYTPEGHMRACVCTNTVGKITQTLAGCGFPDRAMRHLSQV